MENQIFQHASPSSYMIRRLSLLEAKNKFFKQDFLEPAIKYSLQILLNKNRISYLNFSTF